MSGSHDLGEKTRRTVLRGVGATLGVGAAAGSAAAHEWATGDGEESGPAGENTWVSQEQNRGETENAETVGYHALGSAGASNPNPRAEAQDPHYGGITEIATHGDYAYVTFFSSDSPTPGRGMAIVDISSYNRADSKDDLDAASMSVVSFLRNNNTGAAMMDVKVSDDGQYVFVSTQPYTALFGGLPNTNSDDPTHAEAADPTPNTDDESASPQPAGILAVDVSDKANPETVGQFALEGTGCHNAYHHRIGGEDYVFAIQDSGNQAYVGEGMFVFRFDRVTGGLELVNRWHFETNNRQGEVSTEGAYIHDMEVQDDPRTGTPVVYLAYWGRGMWALDASDPANLEPLGHFEMASSHFATPAPTLVPTPDGGEKRVAVTSQEIPASDTHTGRVYLVDCDGLFESDPDYDSVQRDDAGVAQLGELAMWEWQNEYQYPDVENAVEFGPYDFSLSPHNSDVAVHADGTFWVHQAHYGGGIRYLKIVPGHDDGNVGAESRFDDPGEDSDGDGLTGAADSHTGTDWALDERGFARPTYGTPKDSRIEGLNYITPFVWGANESNGVTFASDINQGIHAVSHDEIPLGGAPPVATVSRSDDGDLFTAGQTNRVSISLEFTDTAVLVRDRVPDGWNVVAGDGSTDGNHVTFDLAEGSSASYFAEAPSESGSYTFGPIEVSADGGDSWHPIAGTTDTAYVLGKSSELSVGTAVGAGGLAAHQRDRIAEWAGDLLGRDE